MLKNPCPDATAYFGESTSALDMEADGRIDLAVGAFGVGRVYLFSGSGANHSAPSFQGVRLFQATGPVTCAVAPADDGFGYDVWGGQLDSDAADELVVGAPFTTLGGVNRAGCVYVFGGLTGALPLQLTAPTPEFSELGGSVVVGDFNADGHGDVAAGARLAPVGSVAAGKVLVFFGPFGAGASSVLELENPYPVQWGNFGHHLAVGDSNSDGIDDLVLSATGNTAQQIPVAGQVFCFPGPIQPNVYTIFEDPNPSSLDLPAPRFGMHVAARDEWVGVGANRKDWAGVHDAGLGFAYQGTSGVPTLHAFPSPNPSDYMGFRVAIANVVGDAALDFTFVMMPNQSIPQANRLALVTWDGNNLLGPPARTLKAIGRSADHFANGLSWAQLVPGGYEELIVGDPTYDKPGVPNTGRVVIYF